MRGVGIFTTLRVAGYAKMFYILVAVIEGLALDAFALLWKGLRLMSENSLVTSATKARKDRLVNVRLTDAEHGKIEEAAKAADMSVSAFFRSLLLEGAGVRPILTRDDRLIMAALLEDMRKIGVNLNQVARALNSGKAVHPSELDINLANVQSIQAAVMLELRSLSRRAGYQRRGEE